MTRPPERELSQLAAPPKNQPLRIDPAVRDALRKRAKALAADSNRALPPRASNFALYFQPEF
jgi:hypothetical protein